ncbi:retron St85 family RNA-directed DNA polymerase [Simplicispira hankyongi]|uniref:RNA-directed DNA polymerase n=1 Tax=Simplicispira hankyongi TaxID=2315688 RepID=A0A398CAC5_9BURK|nr:retron St85 family RNA-directed DNA polymerase [Simplicispira hankyongi]RID97818.1 RNA-directed DNA polymerase [Simplicispira hankyongi]
MTNFPVLIADQMKVPVVLVEDALKLAFIRYRKIRVPKRSGGYRTIIQPAAELKLVQAWLNEKIFKHLPLSSVATAFRPGASITNNAAIHRNSLYSVRVDIKDFFPSIRSVDLIRIVRSNRSALPPFVMETGFTNLVRQACFDREGRLPIGYPTSPSIANAVMHQTDKMLINEITSDVSIFGNTQLTRYADDFVFSTDKSGACHEFVRKLERLLSTLESPRLKLNTSKTKFMSRRGGSTLVTGLRINQEGLVRVHANYRDHVRLLLKHFAAGSLQSDDVIRLVGHLAFVEHADPRLFTRLSFRYFEEIARLRGK